MDTPERPHPTMRVIAAGAPDTPPAAARRPFIVPLFLPQAGCPFQCAFCNQRHITGKPQGIPASDALRRQIEQFLSYRDERRGETQIAFYGGNFLGLGQALVEKLLALAEGYVSAGQAAGIRFSTRPDSVHPRQLQWVAPYTIAAIELGVQSMNDRVLTLARRGHTASDSAMAMARLKEAGYRIGAQLMVGLPGDDDALSLASGEAIARLAPDFVRIYPTLVLRGSRLAVAYRRGRYAPWPLERCVATVKHLYYLFQARGIPVIRMGLQASADLEDGQAVLAGPYHPAFGHLVLSEVFLDRASTSLSQAPAAGEAVRLRVHPRSVACLRGHKNRNLEALRRRFGLRDIQVLADERLGLAELTVEPLATRAL
ncbi:MAG: radical SAM protein [Desulfobacterales bacterium]